MTPIKKAADNSSSSTSSSSEDEADAEASNHSANGKEATESTKGRRSVFDFVGTGIDAETYEDQFKQEYHDETDMEDAFATDDTKEPTMDGSDPEMTPDAGVDRVPSAAYDDSTEQGKPISPAPGSGPKKAASPKQRRNTEPAIPTTLADRPTPPLALTTSANGSAEQASAEQPNGKKDKKPSKSHSKKKLGKRIKPVQPMEALHEEGEDEESSIANSGMESSSVVVAETPSKKKSGGIFSFLKRLGTPKASKAQMSSEEHSGSDAQPPVTISQAAPATPPRSPRSPRSKAGNSAYAEGYDNMRSEIRTYLDTERIFISELIMLRDEYLIPASRLDVPIEHVAVLLAPVEQLISSHSDALKQVDKKALQDHIPIGTILDELLAATNDTYKLYRPKQVMLLSLLDSSPTEKSMADHAAISNWLATRVEEQQANAAANATTSSSAAPGTSTSTASAAKRSQSVSAALAARTVLPLQELILVPLHHLVGIVSLLDRLLEVTPQVHPDHPNIRKASARAHLLQTDFSARGTTYRSMAKLTEIDAMLEFPSGLPLVLADETSKRSYLLEGPAYQLEQQIDHSQFCKIYLFLFSDMALICKQLARDPTSMSRSPSAANRRRQSSSRRQSSTNAKGISVITPRGERDSPSPASSSAAAAALNGNILSTPVNKYIVISRLALDRIFVVDPEDVRGEMTTFSNAKAGTMDSPVAGRKNGSPSSPRPSGNASNTSTPSKNRKGSKSSTDAEDEEVESSSSDEMREMEDLDCLLEIVDMGVAIHRIRFASSGDKKLWLATLNSALSNIKLSFSVNERQYLYKLLLTSDPKPIFGAYPNEDKLALWPSARFIASLASRQLIERLHSNTFATVNLQRSYSSSPAPAAVGLQNPDSELGLIKAEVANLKREHARQLAELNSRRELDALEISALQKAVRDKDESLLLTTDSPSKGRRPRSGTVDSSDNSNGSKRKPAGRKTKAAVIAAESRADEYVGKYMDLVQSVNAREKRDMEISRRLEANETALKEHSEKLTASLATVTATLEKSQRELEEAKSDRKALAAQTERLHALIERLMTNGPQTGTTNPLAGSGTFSNSSSNASLGNSIPPGSNSTSRLPIKKDPSGTPMGDRISARSNSATGRPIVPIKHTVGNTGSTPNSPIVAPVATKGQPATVQGGSWRAPPAGGSASTVPVSSGSPAPNGNNMMSGSPAPHPAIMSIGQRGKRPSSASLIAAAPLEMPEAGVTADSSESSTSGNPQAMISSRGIPAPGSPAPTVNGTTPATAPSPVVPALFGASGKSSSKLNLGAANGANSAAGGAAAAGGPPVSPGGRNREKKLKNVRFPDGEQEQGKSGSWLSKKLGFASPKPKKDEVPASKAPWRDPPSAGSAGTDSPITVKKANKVDWSQTRAESYFSDDAASDYETVHRDFPSEFDRTQPDFMGSEGSEEAAQ